MLPNRSASSFVSVLAAGSPCGRHLTAHGDRILAEHDSFDALTAVVHGEDLGALVDNDLVLSVSTDAIVRADGLLDGPLGSSAARDVGRRRECPVRIGPTRLG